MNQQIVRIHDAESMTPYSLAKKFSARVILESASLMAQGRYSLLMVKEAFRLYQNKDGVFMRTPEKQFRIRGEVSDILEVQLYFAKQFEAGLHPFPVPAGGIGYLSFEFSQFCDSIIFRDKPDALNMPLASFLFGHVFLICDHYTNLLYILGLNYDECSIDLEKELDSIEERLNDLDFNYLRTNNLEHTNKIISDEESIKKQYRLGVEAIRKDISAGEYYQSVLSRRRIVQTEMSGLEAYKQLRNTNPAPYLFYLDFDGFQILGASPESHITVKNGVAQIRPLAGTRRRGANYEEDKKLEKELLADEKECAEHLMLVDLARNDLGRCCNPTSISVDQYMHVEHFSKVMHIVSTVSGTVGAKYSGIDALRASFPAGTVSGAPKIRAISSLDALETESRQFYAGVVGYIEAGGDLDTCITIRSALKCEDKLYLQAGAGIVYDSDPEREYQETEAKLSGLMHAMGLGERS